jgi:phenylacetate-CoA ligase
LFAPEKFTFDLPGLTPYIHTNLKRAETLAGQRRLLRKWTENRERLHAKTRQSPEEIAAWQLERISFLVDYAFSTHPFYYRLYKNAGFKRGDIVSWDDYNALPCLTKADIIENFPLFQCNFGPDETECLISRTSGSSGKMLTAIFDPAMADHDILHCLRFYEQMLGRPRASDEWLYQLYLVAPYFTSLNGNYPIFTVSQDCPPELILAHIQRLKPAILTGFPSTLLRLGALVDNPKDLGIKAISTNSEPSTKAERRLISEAFGVPVYDEYSSVELCLIATECGEGKYHIVEDNLRVDVLNPDSTGSGEIVATALHNSFMPFIRYRQGDQIQIQSQHSACSCGNCFRTLSTFMGRTDQFLESRVTGSVPPDRLMALYDRVLLTEEARLSEFQIVQTAPDCVTLYLVPASGHRSVDARTLRRFQEGLRELFCDPNLEIRTETVDAIPPGKSHKRRLIENRIPLEKSCR